MTKEKKKTGRPSDFRPEYCNQLLDHSADGLSMEAFAGVLRKSKQTLYSWKERHPEWKEACEVAEGVCQLFWERKAIEGNETIKTDDGTTVTRSIPPAVLIFNFKNRFKWRDSWAIDAKVDATVSDGTAKEVKELTEVLMNLIKEEK